MSKNIKTNLVPKPCQENWLEMSSDEKSRFCTLCQKNIFDYTGENSESNENVCLRYATSLQNSEIQKSNILKKVSNFLIRRK